MIYHGVVAHEKRLSGALALARELSSPIPGSSDVVLSIDRAPELGPSANHLKVLTELLDTSTDERDWLTVVEDDAVLCDNFLSEESGRLCCLDSKDQTPFVSWYLGTGRWAGEVTRTHKDLVALLVRAAELWESEWINGESVWHAVAYSVRADRASGLVKWWNVSRTPEENLAAWAKRTGTGMKYSHPSLVDHLDGPRLAVGSRSDTPGVERRAWSFMGRGGWRAPGHLHSEA